MEKEEMTNGGLDFYRIKTEWTKECESGELNKVKTEELVMATSYTEAEKVAYEIANDQCRTQFGSMNIEIIKTKISDVLFNNILAQDEHTTCGLICNFFEESEESGVGLYMVKVVIFTIDEKSGKTKRNTQTFFVPATSNSDATKRVEEQLLRTMSDFVIRDTKFDKAEAIYWPTDVHQSKVTAADLRR
jgi:hypothetical protein